MSQKINDATIATRIEPSLAEKLAYHAKANDITTSQLLRKFVKEWVAEQDKKHKKQFSLID
jgi:hypothetical protein